MKIDVSYIFSVHEWGHFVSPMVLSHSCDFLLTIQILTLLLLIRWKSRIIIFLFLFHIFQISLNLIFKGIKWSFLLLFCGLSRRKCIAILLLIGFLCEHLNFSLRFFVIRFHVFNSCSST